MSQHYFSRILSCLVVWLISSTNVFAQEATTSSQAAIDPSAKCITPAKTLMDYRKMQPASAMGVPTAEHGGY